MNFPLVNKELMLKICKHGEYYNPANQHYDNKSVSCDRCFKKNIKVYIGYEKYDLCFSCVESIVTYDFCDDFKKKPKEVLKKMAQRQFTTSGKIKTKMIQKQFTPSREMKSTMMQRQFDTSDSESTTTNTSDDESTANKTKMKQKQFDTSDDESTSDELNC
jgi:hypothetical protein